MVWPYGHPLKALETTKRSAWIRQVCSVRDGFGVDGILFLEKPSPGHVAWDFYNSDGSMAEMCGNAARCVGEVVGLKPREKVLLETVSGEIEIKRDENGALHVGMRPIQILNESLAVEVDGKVWQGPLLDTGVPHFVVPWMADAPSAQVSTVLRSHPLVGPRGANITWLKKETDLKLTAVTFERGVEDFTPACGTGAVAAAWTAGRGAKQLFEIAMPGGILRVDLNGSIPWLSGPVEVVGEVLPHKEIR